MRNLSAAFQAALENNILYPLLFYKAEFASNTLRLWTGFGDRTGPDGGTFTGVGWLIGQSEVEETTELKATSMTIGLKANAAVVSAALAEWRPNRAFTVWLGLNDPVTRSLIADPVVWYSGLSDISVVTVDPDKPSVQLRYKSQHADLDRARARYQTPEDQALDYDDDTFYNFVNPDAAINWGARS